MKTLTSSDRWRGEKAAARSRDRLFQVNTSARLSIDRWVGLSVNRSLFVGLDRTFAWSVGFSVIPPISQWDVLMVGNLADPRMCWLDVHVAGLSGCLSIVRKVGPSSSLKNLQLQLVGQSVGWSIWRWFAMNEWRRQESRLMKRVTHRQLNHRQKWENNSFVTFVTHRP